MNLTPLLERVQLQDHPGCSVPHSGLEKSDAPGPVPNSFISILIRASVSPGGNITLARFATLSLGGSPGQQRSRGAVGQVGPAYIQSWSHDSGMLHPCSSCWARPFLSSSDVVITAVIRL